MVINTSSLVDPSERYVLGQSLGTGIFGKVHEATDKEAGGKKVAVKIVSLTSENEKGLNEEYNILKGFTSHANLIDFYGIFCDKTSAVEKIWFVVEYCEGGPAIDLVRGLLNMGRQMKMDHIAFILKETIKGLVFLHENNIIHRDVRASNILLTKEGDVKLTDFGLSCKLSSSEGRRNTTIGSPSWMAPEVVAGGDSRYGIRADVWALGITAIELADGKAPFQDMHPTRALFQIVRNPPPGLLKPANWPNDYIDFITECLEKNPDHRPYSVELMEHPLITEVPENDYHLTQELKMLLSDVGNAGKEGRLPERLVRGSMLQTEANPEPEVMHVEDLAALDNITEDKILNEIQMKISKGTFHTFIGDILLIINPNCELDIYSENVQQKYCCKSRSDNEPHIYAVADSAYQDALHHNEPQFIIFSGESRSGKTTSMLHALKHLAYLGKNQDITGLRIEKAMKILQAATSAGTLINGNSSRCILQTQVTYGKSGKLSGAIFWLYQLEKWRVSTTDMTHANFNLIYYFYDAMEAMNKLADYSLEPERKYRYLRIPEAQSKAACHRDDPAGNVERFKEIEQFLRDLEFDEAEIEGMWKIIACILILGNVRFKDSPSGAAELENPDEAAKVTVLLGIDQSKFTWALINYCLVERGTAVKRRHSTDEARDARDVLAATIYRRLIDWLVNTINSKLAFSRSVFGDKYSISLLDMFGFECFHRNRLEQLIVNTMNEQMQFFYNQKVFAWEMQDQEEEQVPTVNLHYYDNKPAVDQLISKPLGLFYILDEACRTNGGQEYIMSTIKNSSKGVYLKLSGSHEFSVAHYTGKINYDARDLAEKNRDFLPPEMIETLRSSTNCTVRHFFTNKLTKSGSLTAPTTGVKTTSDKKDEEKARKYNTESKGQYSQIHRMRTAATTYRATSLELLKNLSIGGGGTHFVRCLRSSLATSPTSLEAAKVAFQPDVVRQQLRALAVLDTARARQTGYSARIPFAEFIRRYKFLAFDFDENVEISKDNCRLLLIRLKMEGWVIGKSRVFLRYYNEEYLSRLYETQVRKIIKVQSMMRAFLARRRMEKNQTKKTGDKPRQVSFDMTPEQAATKIQKAFRGYSVRKAYGPLINKSTGKIDEETAGFIRKYAARWRSRSIFQVLLQYRALKYQDLVNFSQQVHIFNQVMMENLIKNKSNVPLEKIDPQARPLEFLGPKQPSVWKLPFNAVELPYFDTTYLCDPSTNTGDTIGYDSDPEAWDEPLQRRGHPASQHIRNSIKRSASPYSEKTAPGATQPLIHVPYCRDPTQPVKKLPADTSRQIPYTPKPYNRQSYSAIQPQAWNDSEQYSKPSVYKKKHAPPTPTYCAPVLRHVPSPTQKRVNNNAEDSSKIDKNMNVFGGPTPTALNNPIKELEQLAKSQGINNNDDDPPFNFQAMLRKTPRNRESMKRTGESPLSVAIEPYSSPITRGKGKAPPRPRSCQDFKRKDSVELFKMALKRTDSSQLFKNLSNGNLADLVEIAPGITVEGVVTDL